MAKILQLGALTELIDKVQKSLEGKKLESFDENLKTTAVSDQLRDDAVAALADAKTKLSRICQEGVLGVKAR
jgi:hypothetical protein